MKIIDLIVKLANGEKVPKKIKYQGDIYLYNEDDNVYEALEYCQTLLENVYECDLNDEIEIIEEVEDKEYEDIEEGKEIELYKTYQDYLENNFTITMANIISDIEAIFNENNDKINALIRNQKYILERLDKNERRFIKNN